MFIFWNEYTATAQEQTVRGVNCRECGCKFSYTATITGVGKGDSLFMLNNNGARARSQRRAAKDLRKKLEKEVVPCPCPQCGVYQDEMVRTLRKHRYSRFSDFGFASLLVAGFLGMLLLGKNDIREHNLLQNLLIISIAIMIVLYTIQFILKKLYDPNRQEDHDMRLELARNAVNSINSNPATSK